MLIQADSRAIPLVEGCVQCVVTSPPYFGLRDYGVSGQIGLEATPDAYVAALVGVFREVRRVLRDDGVCWLNLGDSYATQRNDHDWLGSGAMAKKGTFIPLGYKQKDLLGIPWRVAFALQADGWTLRSDVVWSKPNPMPESVTDRPTKSHEYLFMLSKAKWVGAERGRFADISDSDARWLALFLDTEGSIVVKRVERNGRKWYGAQIVFASTSRELLSATQSIIGAGTIAQREGQNAPMFYLQLSNRQASALLYRIYPFLIVKQRQARIAIHLQQLLKYRGGRGEDRFRTDAEVAILESLWTRNKACNHFGTPDLSDVPEPKYGRWDSQTYYYDAQAIAEPVSAAMLTEVAQGYDGLGLKDYESAGVQNPSSVKARIIANARKRETWRFSQRRAEGMGVDPTGNEGRPSDEQNARTMTRNRRSVWTVNTMPYSGAHFATMPEKLVEPCILAGSRMGDLVFDPFIGSGTVGAVAERLGRRWVGCDLNPAYHALALKRTAQRGLRWA